MKRPQFTISRLLQLRLELDHAGPEAQMRTGCTTRLPCTVPLPLPSPLSPSSSFSSPKARGRAPGAKAAPSSVLAGEAGLVHLRCAGAGGAKKSSRGHTATTPLAPA